MSLQYFYILDYSVSLLSKLNVSFVHIAQMQVGVTFKLTLIGKIMDKDISEHFSDYCKS